MPAITTTTLSSGNNSGSIREDLANFISNVDRDETPFMSSIGSSKATNTYHEWLTDTYADPVENAQTESYEFDSSRAAASGRTRIGNYTQVFAKQVYTSGSTESVDTAAVASEYAYQLRKRGVELRREKEFQALRYLNNPTAAADVNKAVQKASDPRRSSSVFAFAANAVVKGISGTNTTYIDVAGAAGADAGNTSVGGKLPTAIVDADGTRTVSTTGSASAVDRDDVENLITSMYENGGKPKIGMTTGAGKVRLSKLFLSDSTTSEKRTSSMESKLNIAVSGVITDFGFDIALVPNYLMTHAGATSEILFYDSAELAMSVLTQMKTEMDGTARYGKGGIIVEECTLEVKSPHSVGAIYNADFS